MFSIVKLVFLGVGGWISDPLLGYTSFAVFNSRGDWILVEAGEGVYRSMRECGLRLDSSFKGVLISHRHGDHILGVPTILQMTRHMGIERISIVSIDDVVKALAELLDASGSWSVAHIANFIRVNFNERFVLDGFEIELIEAVHSVPTASIKILVDGRCIVYSGDTSYNPKLIEFAKGCDVLVHEVSTYGDEAHRYGHSTYRDAIDVAIRSGVKRLILIHFYQWPQPIKAPIHGDIEILVSQPCQCIEI
ncbi:MAG: MBL fold metallo-hydrolase [Ignisphaera sp.]